MNRICYRAKVVMGTTGLGREKRKIKRQIDPSPLVLGVDVSQVPDHAEFLRRREIVVCP